MALIGVGSRGRGHASRLASIEGAEIVAISDLYEDLAKRSEQSAVERGRTELTGFWFHDHPWWGRWQPSARLADFPVS